MASIVDARGFEVVEQGRGNTRNLACIRTTQKRLPRLSWSACLGILALFAAAGCRGGARPPDTAPEEEPSATSVWSALLRRTPLAYPGTSLPEPGETGIDGTYFKLDASWPQWWQCYRCADYRPAGGVWRLQFDRGVMRILYDVTRWRSLASYAVEGDRLLILHDAYCRHVGEYRWELGEAGLALRPIEDGCAFGLRAENLGSQMWTSCRDGRDSAGYPQGCLEPRPDPEGLPTAVASLRVEVHAGDVRTFPVGPDFFARANPGTAVEPVGVEVAFSPTSIPYGVNRILWWEGAWVEARAARPFSAMGVQFLGGPQIGWARVLLDGVEVWRGITGELGCRRGYCGGYLELSGFEAGPHVLRVESVTSDYRPVEVVGFGFSLSGPIDASP